MEIKLKAGVNDHNRRLDRILRKTLPDCSLSLIHRLLRQGKVLVNGVPAGPNEHIQSGSEIQVELSVNSPCRKVNDIGPVSSDLLPEILWRGSGIIIFNKPSGLQTHGRHSLDSLVTAYLAGVLPPSLSFKPGPLHRLDKQTSGAIAFSESIEGARLFSRLLQERKLLKTYLAIVEGNISGEKVWQDTLVRDRSVQKTKVTESIDAKDAFTKIKSIASNTRYSLVEAVITTGRTHQIRAQAAAHGHPLAGDRKYGGHGLNGFFLHAWKMEFGDSVDFPRLIIAPLPELFQSQIKKFFNNKSYLADSLNSSFK